VSVTWEINGVDENGDQISYYVQLKSEELEKFEAGTTRLYDTNADTATTAGANLVYYELTTNEEGTEYFVAKDPTTVEMWTPQVQIVNLGSSDNTIPNNPPQEEIKEENTPKENAPEETITEEDVPLVDIFDEEVPLADVPHTGDNSIYFVIMSVLAVMGLAVLALTKKREEA